MTWQPSPAIVAEMLAIAEQRQPKEACGLVVDGDTLIEIENKATDYDAFVMDRWGVAQALAGRTLTAVVHSHVYLPPIPSDADRAACERLGVPWLIVSFPLGSYQVIEPCGWTAPLVGRNWAWGTQDCYGLVRDAYRLEAGIEIPDYPRDWEWWEHGGNILADQFEEAGFIRLPQGEEPKHLDAFLLQVVSKVPNHCGVFLAPDLFLHHLMNRISVREKYGGLYRKTTTHHLRHRSLA